MKINLTTNKVLRMFAVS